MQNINCEKVGFIISSNLDNKTEIQFKKLLARLNKKYPMLFPFCSLTAYSVIYPYSINSQINLSDDGHILKIKNEINDLSTVICFGEKAHHTIKKLQNIYQLKLNIIKTKTLSYPLNRHVRLQNKEITNRVRTDFNVLMYFNEIDKQLLNAKRG